MLREKNQKKGLPRKDAEKTENVDFVEDDDEHNPVTAKSSIETLKDLEEDPVGTPRSNAPENYVVVVTNPPITT